MGACFEALFMDVLMAASDFSCNFFGILTSGFEQCAEALRLKEPRGPLVMHYFFYLPLQGGKILWKVEFFGKKSRENPLVG